MYKTMLFYSLWCKKMHKVKIQKLKGLKNE